MIDITYKPTITEDEILLVTKQEKRVNANLVSERTGYDEETVTEGLENLVSHGWVEEVSTDLYEFVDDPRGSGTRMKPGVDPNKETQTAPIDPSDMSEENNP